MSSALKTVVVFVTVAVCTIGLAVAQHSDGTPVERFMAGMQTVVDWQETLPEAPGWSADEAATALSTLQSDVLPTFSLVDVSEPVWSLCSREVAGLTYLNLIHSDSEQHLDHNALQASADEHFALADELIATHSPTQLCLSPARRAYPAPSDATSIRDELDTFCRVLTDTPSNELESVSDRQRLMFLVARAGNMSTPVRELFSGLGLVTMEDRYAHIQSTAAELGVAGWRCRYLEDSRFPWFSDSAEITLARAAPSSEVLQVSEPSADSITLTSSGVLLNDEYIVGLRDGHIPEGQRVSSRSPIVPALAQAMRENLALREQWTQRLGREADTDYLFIVHSSLPYITVAQVLFTAYSAGMGSHRIVLRTADDGWTERVMVEPPTSELGTATLPSISLHVSTSGVALQLNVPSESASAREAASELSQPHSACSEDGVTFCKAAALHLGYSRLVSIHDDENLAGVWPEVPYVVISADPEVPWQSVVDIAEIVRWRRDSPSFQSDEAMWASPMHAPAELFQQIGLNLPAAD